MSGSSQALPRVTSDEAEKAFLTVGIYAAAVMGIGAFGGLLTFMALPFYTFVLNKEVDRVKVSNEAGYWSGVVAFSVLVFFVLLPKYA